MNIHSNHLFYSIAICLVSIMALFTSCDKTDNVTGGINSPDENTRYLLQPPYISIEPFGGGSPATRSAVAIEEERQAFNIGDELGNIITLGNSEVEDSPQTRALANNTYYRIVIYKKSDWDNNSLNIHAQRLCKTGSSAYLADAGDEITPIYLNPGDYRIFCYSFNKTSYTKLTPLTDGTTNVPLSDGDDFLSADIIEKNINNDQLGSSVSLGTITLKHRCCRLTGTLSTEAFISTGISASSTTPSLSVTSSFYTAGNWSIKSPVFSGTSASSAAKTIPISVNGNTYTGSLIVLPPASKSLSASYKFQPNGGMVIDVSNKSITTSTTFSSGGSYSFTIKAIGAYVLTETEAVKIGSYTWAYANLNGATNKQESKPWISGPLTGSGIPSAKGDVTTANNDWWRWNVLGIDTDSDYGTEENTWNISNDPCHVGLKGSWIVPPLTYFDELVPTYKLVKKRVYINGETMTTNEYGWVQGDNIAGCVFADTELGTCIFLPAVGRRDGSSYNYAGTYGYYWTATLSPHYPNNAYYFCFSSGSCYLDHYYRYFGRSLRCAQ